MGVQAAPAIIGQVGRVRQVRQVGRVRQVRQVGRVRQVGQVGQVRQVRQVGGLGRLGRLRGLGQVRAVCKRGGYVKSLCNSGFIYAISFSYTLCTDYLQDKVMIFISLKTF